MANVIEQIQKPTLIIAHNKTLAAQLAAEFREFFPKNAVHYFVSYYDYYQPEAYVKKTDAYIEKEATVNEEIDRLRHAATQDLISRKDVIIVASVSCIYGIGDIDAYSSSVFHLEVGRNYSFDDLKSALIRLQYVRAGVDLTPGTFQIQWETIRIFPTGSQNTLLLEFFGEDLENIYEQHATTGKIYSTLERVDIFPAKHTVTTKETINRIVPEIQKELEEQLQYFKKTDQLLKHERLQTKINYELEMLQENGYVNGIENYSRYLDGRQAWQPPTTLIDYFGDDFLCFVDESHMTISQIGGMYAGDRARKENLIEAGFRLPSALDNRPLQFDEFEKKIPQMVLVSATPGQYDIQKSSQNPEKYFSFDPIRDGVWQATLAERIVPLVIRPTGLLDPIVEIGSMEYMSDEVMHHISEITKAGEKMLIITLTKRSSQELCDYLLENGVRVRYLHSEIETLDRIEIIQDLRKGHIDVIVGVNLLREWLDLPEVTKIAILDADKQGFLRSSSSLIQLVGRAARNSKGTVYMYVQKYPHIDQYTQSWPVHSLLSPNGDKIPLYFFNKGSYITADGLIVSESMRVAINITNYRRSIQMQYNTENHITPQTVLSDIKEIGVKSKKRKKSEGMSTQQKETLLKRLQFEMEMAAETMDYERAAEIRDEIRELKGERK